MNDLDEDPARLPRVLPPDAEIPVSIVEARMGVYAVRNVVDGAVYVGGAVDIGVRWGQHRAALERSCHPNDALQAAWVQLGAAAFELTVLEEVGSYDDLAQAEQRWIDRYRAEGVHRVYNAQSRAIRKRRTPLNLDQAARRLHLSTRQLLRWVRDGRVPCRYGLSEGLVIGLTQPSSQPVTRQLGFDRDDLDAVAGRLRQPAVQRGGEIGVRLRALQHRVGHWLHVAT